MPLSTPEAKAALKIAVAEAVAATKAEAEANSESVSEALRATNAKLAQQLREAKKGAEIDPVKHAALEDKVLELETQLGASASAIKKMEKDHTNNLSSLTKQLESESGFTQTLLVENGLSDALMKAGVEANFLPAVKAMLKSQVKVVAEGHTRRAIVGDKPLADFVTGWAQSDEGRHFVKAPVNAGGGANGGSPGNSGGGHNGKQTIIAANDKAAIGANLAELAKGIHSAVRIA